MQGRQPANSTPHSPDATSACPCPAPTHRAQDAGGRGGAGGHERVAGHLVDDVVGVIDHPAVHQLVVGIHKGGVTHLGRRKQHRLHHGGLPGRWQRGKEACERCWGSARVHPCTVTSHQHYHAPPTPHRPPRQGPWMQPDSLPPQRPPWCRCRRPASAPSPTPQAAGRRCPPPAHPGPPAPRARSAAAQGRAVRRRPGAGLCCPTTPRPQQGRACSQTKKNRQQPPSQPPPQPAAAPPGRWRRSQRTRCRQR